jgi:hypothetical protein
MRYQSIRTIVRTAIAAGLVASCQGAALPASWRESLQPYAGTCYVHDLQWEQFGSFPAIRSESLENNIVSSNTSTDFVEAIASNVGTPIVPTIETDHCIAAALQFEMRTKLDAAWKSIQSQSLQWIGQKDRLFSTVGIARKLLVDTANAGAYKLVELVRIPDTLPVTAVELVDTNLADASSSMSDWNCTDWNRDCNPVSATHLPTRTQANLCVYSFDASGHLDAAGLNSFSANNHDNVARAGETEAVSPQGAAPVASHVWQTGVDPVCPEIHLSNKAFRWSELAEQPTVCCPIDNMEYETRVTDGIASHERAIVAESTVRPPTLDAEMAPPSADVPSSAAIDYALIDSIEVAYEPVDAPEEAAVKPITSDEGAIATQTDSKRFENWQPWLQGRYQYDGSMQRFDNSKNNVIMVAPNGPRYAQKWVDLSSSVVQWQSPENWRGLADWVSPYFADSQQLVETPPFVASPEILTSNSPYETSIKDFGPYNPQDFVVEKVESSQGTLILPMWYANRLAFGIAKDLVWKPMTETSLTASKVMAKQMRNMGQLLMDMAMKIELEADRVEIARRDNNQR